MKILTHCSIRYSLLRFKHVEMPLTTLSISLVMTIESHAQFGGHGVVYGSCVGFTTWGVGFQVVGVAVRERLITSSLLPHADVI